ncbi:MAG: phosphonoacetaldehyde hydrolase [Clostridiales bacterium]|nr:phosphonoacetaldehyde hydrolase [Clostridiales bacterium]
MKFEAVIFDWAGTTVDYGCFAPVQAFMEIFREYGIEPTMEETRKPMGMLKWDHIKTMLQMERIEKEFRRVHGRAFTDQDVDEMHEKFASSLMGILHKFARPKDYVTETVAKLREMGIKIGSTTGYTDAMMEIVTREAKKAGYEPDCWFSPDSTNHVGRPYPYMVFRNMEALKISAVDRVMKVGDTISDIREGKNAGAFTVGVIEGSSEMALTKEEYEGLDEAERQEKVRQVTERYLAAGADCVVMDIRGILELIGE